VQPFGGEGLSGTGPKAGGPLYLRRLMKEVAQTPLAGPVDDDHPLHVLRDFVAARAPFADLVATCDRLAAGSPSGQSHTLPGPTGERNAYTLLPRDAVLCIAFDRGDLLMQFATVLAAGSRLAVWLDNDASNGLLHELPSSLRERVVIDSGLLHPFDAALIQADDVEVATWSRRLAQRDGPIVGLQCAARGARGPETFSIERLMAERSISVNTAAAGGNASLMTIG
jgi:RHH-type proline utilization regulon transcriptional repressor/proline dehydrogenase/delta 1-pyrroline-5-carboxylate dehydrogenase